ncbi:hypothetical protein IGM_06763 [Bacillus cereus HuB4-4]|uniref:Uncharacterized protein n=1 Tax=Bacillus cereus HuB4-4 TaxID=1053211 RepID=A0A9W5VI00_BACCE|nr:hypothetical protein [Bacillus cereus]EOP77810.1 hypothetical protein IGM_06763 [Bacillus cereus HuB4-4]
MQSPKYTNNYTDTNNIFNQILEIVIKLGVCVAMEQDNATSISGH